MPPAIQLDDRAYAIAKEYAEQARCSLASAVNTLVVKSGGDVVPQFGNDASIRFPLVHGTRPITNDDVARLDEEQ